MKKYKAIVFIMILSILFTPLIITYAWFTSYIGVTPLVLQTANIASSIKLKKGQDFNYDGNLDLDDENKFIYGDESISSGGYPVLNLTIEDMFPSQIHTWGLTIQNLGDANGYIFLTISNMDDEQPTNEGNLFKALSIRIIDDETNMQIGQKTYLASNYDNNILSCMVINGGNDNVVGYLGSSLANTKMYRFCIEFETYENLPLVDVGGQMVKPLTETEYQNLSGITFNNFFMRLYLTSSNSSEILN